MNTAYISYTTDTIRTRKRKRILDIYKIGLLQDARKPEEIFAPNQTIPVTLQPDTANSLKEISQELFAAQNEAYTYPASFILILIKNQCLSMQIES